MSLTRPAYVAALLGGLVWIARWLADAALTDGTSGLLHWVGTGLFALALAVAGASLVSSSAPPLRALVAVAFPLLMWSVVEFVRPADDALFLGLLGALGASVAVVGLARSRPEKREKRQKRQKRQRRPPARRAGSHAA